MYDFTEPLSIETLAIRAGQRRTAESEHSDPIFATSSFVFDNAADAAAKFSGATEGNVYSRFTNPTVRGFEDRLAAMEGGRFAIATASGMSAILCLALSVLKAGDRVAVSENVFGSTVSLFTKTLSRFGVTTDFVALTDLSAWQRAMSPRTRLLFVETPSNPTCEIADLASLSKIAKEAGVLFVVDNVYCTPVLQKPLEYGADVVVHSATKYLDGQGRCVGGALVVNDRALYDELFNTLRTSGPSMSPFNAWVFQKGLETLALRMKGHCEYAAELADWLQGHPAVRRVFYPGLSSHPGHLLALKQQRGFGGIVAFEIHGSRSDAWQVIDHTRLLSITANLGDSKSTITHPASTTHARITEKQRQVAGITDSLIRIGVGLEHPDDIKLDLRRGLDSVATSESRLAD
ncbi:MAG: O-succinylhomoserine sulfhydrylase [Proteobacteria bacterium]|jgi:O-succinylhomoserine sulfhydrylase|nr:O-succinylhomoserine sulfhydrylase [Pseudomonadota bacterium]MBT4988583.1 O-succinylhomoserine sulfhydrylase [Pseudomonadota bacterium]MBT7812400.1 O-succinylhomoserine sulfhydrylase [Pseudomonadota bacterium]MBT7965614.1 O-succinylhomoserine sulfhydrylase [Pseudomonadota bacterium]